MIKKILILGLVIFVFGFESASASNGKLFVEFKPQGQKYTKQDSVSKTKKTATLVSAAKLKTAVLGVSDDHVKKVVIETLNSMAAQGLFKGEKGDKGDAVNLPTMSSYNPDAVGIQTVYVPAGVVGPDVGTVFAATQLSSESLLSKTATFEEMEVSGSLTLQGSAEFQGHTSLATATIASLHVMGLTSESGAYLSSGGDWINASSKNLKENFSTTSPAEILLKIEEMPIFTWNYKNQSSAVRHMGPLAEDFYAKFGLGGEDGSKGISTIDPAGVALVGVQGLNQKLKEVLDFSWVVDGLRKIGLEINNGILTVRNMVAESVRVAKLEVGSTEAPTGITIYDRATGQPGCIFLENGILKTEPGGCENVSVNEQVSDIIIEVPGNDQQNIISEPENSKDYYEQPSEAAVELVAETESGIKTEYFPPEDNQTTDGENLNN